MRIYRAKISGEYLSIIHTNYLTHLKCEDVNAVYACIGMSIRWEMEFLHVEIFTTDG